MSPMYDKNDVNEGMQREGEGKTPATSAWLQLVQKVVERKRSYEFTWK